MAQTYYPLALKLQGRKVFVAGGGKVAERKVKLLLAFKACVRVVAPELTEELKSLVSRGKISVALRSVCKRDVQGAGLVIAATSQRAVNKKVSLWARKNNVLINVVDQPALSDFISPAVFKTKKAVVAVHTNGHDPVLSKDLKNFLKEYWDVFLSYRYRLQKSPA